MALWRFVVLTSAGAEVGWTLDSAERVRAGHDWALKAYARHEIDDWQWWRLRPEPADRACPRCGYEYAPGRSRLEDCRCGTPHAVYQCPRCGDRVEPLHAPGCAPIPYDPGAYRPHRPLRRRPR